MEENARGDSIRSASSSTSQVLLTPLITPISSLQSSIHIPANTIKYQNSKLEFLPNALTQTNIILHFFVHENRLGFDQDPNFSIPSQKFTVLEGFNIPIACSIPKMNYEYSNGSLYPMVIEATNKDMSEVTILEIRGENLKVLQQRMIRDRLMYEIREIFNPPAEDTDEIENNCVICLVSLRNTVIEPCCHVCLCEICANSMREQMNRKCPMCRQGN